MGRSGDGKRNILWGWPMLRWLRYEVLQMSARMIKMAPLALSSTYIELCIVQRAFEKPL